MNHLSSKADRAVVVFAGFLYLEMLTSTAISRLYKNEGLIR